MNKITSYATASLGGVICIGLVSCAGLPQPPEFDQACAEIDRAEASDAESYFPNTIERANARLDRAEDLLSEADDAEDIATKETKRAEALREAGSAQALAESAQKHYQQVQTWDSDSEKYAGTVTAAESQAPTPTEKLTYQEGAGDPLNTTKTVAFFKTGSAEVDMSRKGSIDEVAKMLVERPEWNVQLIGYTDPRGSEELNKVLAQRRIQSVMTELQKYGIDSARITTKPVGQVEEAVTDRSKLPLARRVDVLLYDTATATDQMRLRNDDRG